MFEILTTELEVSSKKQHHQRKRPPPPVVVYDRGRAIETMKRTPVERKAT
jgi:hypothetical protein